MRAATFADLVAIEQVGREHVDGNRQLCCHLLEPLDVAGDEDEVVPLGGELAGELGPDARRSARDESRRHELRLYATGTVATACESGGRVAGWLNETRRR